MRSRKKQYYQNFIDKHKQNSRCVWQRLNQLLGLNSYTNNTLPLNDPNVLNKFFAELGTNTTNNIKNSKNFYQHLHGAYLHSFYFLPTTPNEILTIINSLKNKNCVSFDNISMKTIKQIAPYITNHLSDIFNLSFEQGVVPNKFKIARVIPIYKSGDKNNLIITDQSQFYQLSQK